MVVPNFIPPKGVILSEATDRGPRRTRSLGWATGSAVEGSAVSPSKNPYPTTSNIRRKVHPKSVKPQTNLTRTNQNTSICRSVLLTQLNLKVRRIYLRALLAMITWRSFLIYFAVLVAATCGLFFLLVLSLRYFTYSGSGMDWIYPTSGALAILWAWSAFMTLKTGAFVVQRFLAKKRDDLG